MYNSSTHLRRVVLRVAARALCSALALHPAAGNQLSALLLQNSNLLFTSHEPLGHNKK